MTQQQKLYDKLSRRLARFGSSPTYNVYRPNYTAVDQSGYDNLVAGPYPYRTNVGGDKFARPEIRGAFYFDVFGDRANLQPGDILVPTASGTIGAQPPLTIVNIAPMDACVGVMTDKFAQINEDINTVLYTNVMFSWLVPERPRSGLNSEYIDNTIPIGKRKAIMFKRQGIGMNPPLIKGMNFIELSSDKPYIFMIDDVQTYFNTTILSLSENA